MAFQTSDKLFFVLDYCAGGELFFHLGIQYGIYVYMQYIVCIYGVYIIYTCVEYMYECVYGLQCIERVYSVYIVCTLYIICIHHIYSMYLCCIIYLLSNNDFPLISPLISSYFRQSGPFHGGSGPVLCRSDYTSTGVCAQLGYYISVSLFIHIWMYIQCMR